MLAHPHPPLQIQHPVGDWEHILLIHEYRTQQTSTLLTLHADHTSTGALTGTWSYDPENKILTIGTQQLCLERELDWEASPRVPTLVYAGLTPSGRSLWGKKTGSKPTENPMGQGVGSRAGDPASACPTTDGFFCQFQCRPLTPKRTANSTMPSQ